LPDAVLLGDTASAIHAGHRFSRDADPILTDLRSRFDHVLAQLESVAGWKTARVQRPVQILGRRLESLAPMPNDASCVKMRLGLAYVVLHGAGGVLAVYRVRPDNLH